MKRVVRKVSRFCKQFWKYRDLLRLLVSRNIKLKYRRSVLGYAWTILNPLLIMIVMTIVFSTMFGRDIENFPVYLFCGQLLFNFMDQSTHQSISSITGNASLLKKTYVPKYIFTVAKITSSMVDLLLSLIALVLVMIATKAPVSWHMLLTPLVLVQLYFFCLGLGMFLSQANVFFRDVQYIYNAVVTAWRYLSAIFYPLERLPEPIAWVIIHFNPMYYYIGQFRALVYERALPDPVSVMLGCGASIVMMLIGIVSFMRSQDRMIFHI